MRLDIEDVLSRVLPWECQVKLDGKWYKVRPPTLADVDALNRLPTLKGGEVEASKLIQSLFERPQPDLTKMTIPAVSLVTQSVLHYIGEYLSKKNNVKLLNAAGLLPAEKPSPGGTSGNASSHSAGYALASSPKAQS